ncbi:MAG TPA: DUF4163 domain-containing protein [Pyrinomonadaceae bacterium]|jgi:hypothetical protein
MKRIAVNGMVSLLSFTCGVAASLIVNWIKSPKNEKARVTVSAPSAVTATAQVGSTVPIPVVTPEVVFGGGGLRIVTDEVHLKSERLRYQVDVNYPQIVGSKEPHIRRLNHHIRELAIKQYQWPLNPAQAELKYYRDKWPEVFNSVDLDYEIVLADDSFLSIYFIGYSYGIGAAHSVQYSFVLNYDLVSRRELNLSDVFNRRSQYLEIISRYSVKELSKQSTGIFEEALTPKAENFRSWNITRDGLRFNFDACKVFGCADGKQTVEIPLTEFEALLNHQILRKLTKP